MYGHPTAVNEFKRLNRQHSKNIIQKVIIYASAALLSLGLSIVR